MDNKKFWMASAAATGIFAAGSVLWYNGLLRKFYRSQNARGVLRPRPIYALNALSRAAYGLLFAYGYPRTVKGSESSARQGAKYGAWAGALEGTSQILIRAANTRIKLPASVSAIAFETALGSLAGMAVGAIYNSREPHHAAEPMPVEDEETATTRTKRESQRQSSSSPEPITADVNDPMQPPTGAPSDAEVAA